MLDEVRATRGGRVYLAQEPATGAFVVVKTVEEGLPPDRAAAAAGALDGLCRAPLDHPSIVAPLAAGLEGGVPWIAEPHVDGELLFSVMQRGAAPLDDVLLRATQLAGALDFAAAAGIRHGALHPREIIISGERTLISGLGLQQALAEAGVQAPMHDDIQVLAAIAGEWLAGSAPEPLRAVLEATVSGAHHGTALDFAAALQRAGEPQSAVREPLSVMDDALPEVPGPASAPARPDFALDEPELALREPEPPIQAHRSDRVLESHSRPPDRGAPAAGAPAADPRWPAMAAMLAIGLLGGFAAGFVVGQRDSTPVPYSAERAVRRPDAPAPTTGRDSTDAPVPSEVSEPELRIPSAAVPRSPEEGAPNQGQGTASPTGNPEPGTRNPERAALVVDSRPRGARVFVDGRLVGETPLSLPGVAPGEHAVRIDLIGYQRWVTRVTVAPGERTRVAASLER